MNLYIKLRNKWNIALTSVSVKTLLKIEVEVIEKFESWRYFYNLLFI